MRVLSDLVMQSSAIVLNDDQDFPATPRIGQFCFTDGVLYIYATLKGISTWYPLTNKSLYYVHAQGIASLSWSVAHNLESQDLIMMVYDEYNVVQLATEFEFVDANNINILFTEATKGRAVIFAATDEYGAGGSSDSESVVPKIIKTNYTAITGDVLLVDTRLNAVTIYLPASPVLGDEVFCIDGGASWGTNNITINGNGNNILGDLEDLVGDISVRSFCMIYYDDPTIGWTLKYF